MTGPIYSPNEPQPTDSLGESQPNFQQNFLSLYFAFLKNHVSLTDNSLGGKHTIVELLEQSGSIQTDVGDISIYTKDVEGQTDQVFMRYQGNGQEVQITNYQIYTLPADPLGVRAFTFLPGKVIAYFGITNVTFNNSNQSTFKIMPAIAKNIITAVFSTANASNYPPRIDTNTPVNGIYSEFMLTKVLKQPIGGTQNIYYMVLANT